MSNTHKEQCWYLEGQDNDFECTYLRDPRDGLISVSISSATPEALKLIAAAPELLEALRELVEWGTTHTSPSVDVVIKQEDTPHELLVNAVQAIAAAEGTEVEA